MLRLIWREKRIIAKWYIRVASAKGSRDRSSRSRFIRREEEKGRKRGEGKRRSYSQSATNIPRTCGRTLSVACRGCRRPTRIRSVSFESARCVWLTSRPSWPLEGGRPPGRSPDHAPGIGYSDTPAVRHPIIYVRAALVHDTVCRGELSRVELSQARRGPIYARVHHRKKGETRRAAGTHRGR